MPKLHLKRVDINMGAKEYKMYQEIPNDEQGIENEAYGIEYSDFKKYLKKQIDRKSAKLNDKQTPTLVYICYLGDYPVGDICIRTKLNQFWRDSSGNISFKIRPSLRNKGHGRRMLELALDRCKKLGMQEVLLQCNNKNTPAKRVIENNSGVLLRDNGSLFYKITI